MLLGFMMVRRGYMGQGTLSDLTRVLIDVVIPCTFVLAMTRSFTPELLVQSSVLALVSAGWILGALVFGTLWFRMLPGDSAARDRSVTAMMMISNSIYLPLPVILAVTPPAVHDQAVVYISITAIPSILMNWTVGVALLGGGTRPSGRERLKLMINAPIVSLFLGMALSLVPGVRETARSEPGAIAPLGTVFSVMNYLAMILSPLAMLILGGMIASREPGTRMRLRYAVPLIGVRLILAPALVYGLVRLGLLRLPALACTVLIMVAAAPPATNHTLIARKYGGEWGLVSSLQLLVHLAALFTLPVWLSLGLGL